MKNVVLRHKYSTKSGVILYNANKNQFQIHNAFGGITVANASARKKTKIKTRILFSNDIITRTLLHNI